MTQSIAPPIDIDDFVNRFLSIKSMGYVATHRIGNTGVGKTLEDLLGINESNKQVPDFADCELKAMRTHTSCPLTLLSKTPQPHYAIKEMLDKYGYINFNKATSKKALYITLYCGKWKACKKTGKSLMLCHSKNYIEVIDMEGNTPCWWEKSALERVFRKKYQHYLILCYADTKGNGERERFHFHTAQAFSDFSFLDMIKLLDDGCVKVDIHISEHENGLLKYAGISFRIIKSMLPYLFKTKTMLVER